MKNVDYGAILKRSWELTWKNKWLWVYGLILGAASFSYSGGSGGGGGNSSSNSTPSNLPKGVPSNLPQQGGKVLGKATDAVGQWLGQVSPGTWILLGLGVLVLILFVVVIGMIIQAWAKGSLISGLDKADRGEDSRLGATALRDGKVIKNLIYYGVIASVAVLLTIFVIMVLGLGVALLFSVSSILMTIFLVLLGIVGFIVLLIVIVVVAMIGVYAERLIVLKGYAPLAAWKKGLSLAKGNLMNTLVMGLINGGIGCAVSSVGCMVSLLILAIMILPGLALFGLGAFAISSGNYALLVPVVMGALFILMIWGAATLVLRAGLIVFNFSNWNLFFNQVMAQEEHK